MNCCSKHCQATDAKFGRKVALADLERYRVKGADDTTGDIIRAVRTLGLQGASLLDVGGGIGVILSELIGNGIQSGTLVEAASAYLDVARQANERSSEITYVHGDFVAVAHEISDADVVTLDRVVCCYPDYDRLLAAATGKSKKVCIFSYPTDRWLVRFTFALQNLGRRLIGDVFRTFVHPPEHLDRVMVESGFTLVTREVGSVWGVAVYRRAADA